MATGEQAVSWLGRAVRADINQYKAILEALPQAAFLDVRQPYEYAAGHVPEATNVPLDLLPRWAATADRAVPVIVYCRSGARSSSALGYLKQCGFETIVDLGGIMSFRGVIA